jgi:hypothetical protein
MRRTEKSIQIPKFDGSLLARQSSPSASGLWSRLLLASTVGLLALAGCEDDPATVTKIDVITGEDIPGTDAAATTDATEPGTDAVGTETDAAAPGSDADTSEVASGCQTDAGCSSFVVKNCEVAVCNKATGKCEAAPKAGTCCNDVQCDDNNACTLDKCDVTTAQCENGPIANCCAGKEVLLDVGFEQKVLQGFVSADTGKNGNVDWRVETKRARSGKYSVYLGNECYTYDTSINATAACQGGGNGQPINARLRSPTVNLPAGKNAILHFWLWMDTEPPYTKLAPAGTCTQKCTTSQSCINVGVDGSACINENDLLKVKIDDQILDWNSLAFDKTTEGNWRHVSINLAQWTGKGIQVSWEFATGNGQQERLRRRVPGRRPH